MTYRRIQSVLIAVVGLFFCLDAVAYNQMMTDEGLPISWIDTSCFQYSINQDGSDDFDFEELEEITRWSYDVWQDVLCSYFYFEQTDTAEIDNVGITLGGRNTNLLIWHENPEDWGYQSSIIAITNVNYDNNTGRILDVDMEFNGADFDFDNQDSYPLDATVVDYKNTLVHEIGHTVGLDHNEDDIQSTMYPSGGFGNINKRTLDEDDMNGICHIYLFLNDPETCAEPFCGLALTEEDLEEVIDCQPSEKRCGCHTPGFTNRGGGLFKLLLALLSFVLTC